MFRKKVNADLQGIDGFLELYIALSFLLFIVGIVFGLAKGEVAISGVLFIAVVVTLLLLDTGNVYPVWLHLILNLLSLNLIWFLYFCLSSRVYTTYGASELEIAEAKVKARQEKEDYESRLEAAKETLANQND